MIFAVLFLIKNLTSLIIPSSEINNKIHEKWSLHLTIYFIQNLGIKLIFSVEVVKFGQQCLLIKYVGKQCVKN